ncbi:MAG: hypothetical protein LBH98_00815 [Chitinispirillales bacterium]|jgi:hypothetical protein|nr:hypothetical protein [Chitinispirillales bacterium]
MKYNNVIVGVMIMTALALADTEKTSNLFFAGIRSSIYGFDGKFPSPEEAANVILNVSQKLQSAPSAVWLVGTIQDNGFCRLEFPAKGKNISSLKYDRHEKYLSKFDEIGAKIFLQIEAGNADMKTLVDLVMKQYGHHKCVVGFGIDVEWYPSDGTTNCSDDGRKTPLDKPQLQELDKHLKTFGKNYRLFVKHWEPQYLGNSPVSDVIYISDSQDLENLNNMVDEFALWAEKFAPNDVGFQFGYNSDKSWWETMDDPILEITNALKDRIKNQKVHIYWVDFSIRDDRFDNLWKIPQAK